MVRIAEFHQEKLPRETLYCNQIWVAGGAQWTVADGCRGTLGQLLVSSYLYTYIIIYIYIYIYIYFLYIYIYQSRKLASASWGPSCFRKVLGVLSVNSPPSRLTSSLAVGSIPPGHTVSNIGSIGILCMICIVNRACLISLQFIDAAALMIGMFIHG